MTTMSNINILAEKKPPAPYLIAQPPLETCRPFEEFLPGRRFDRISLYWNDAAGESGDDAGDSIDGGDGRGASGGGGGGGRSGVPVCDVTATSCDVVENDGAKILAGKHPRYEITIIDVFPKKSGIISAKSAASKHVPSKRTPNNPSMDGVNATNKDVTTPALTANTLSSLSKLANPSAVFLIPPGRENDYIFSTPKGLGDIAKSAQCARLVAVAFSRMHSYDGLGLLSSVNRLDDGTNGKKDVEIDEEDDVNKETKSLSIVQKELELAVQVIACQGKFLSIFLEKHKSNNPKILSNLKPVDQTAIPFLSMGPITKKRDIIGRGQGSDGEGGTGSFVVEESEFNPSGDDSDDDQELEDDGDNKGKRQSGKGSKRSNKTSKSGSKSSKRGEGRKVRRLFFLKNPHVVQTEAITVPPNPSSTNSTEEQDSNRRLPIDPLTLAFDYHKSIVAGILALVPSISASEIADSSSSSIMSPTTPIEELLSMEELSLRNKDAGTGKGKKKKKGKETNAKFTPMSESATSGGIATSASTPSTSAAPTTEKATETKPKRGLIIGLGGGALPNFLSTLLPHIRWTAIEIDAAVVEIAKEYFDFREKSSDDVAGDAGVDGGEAGTKVGTEVVIGDGLALTIHCSDTSTSTTSTTATPILFPPNSFHTIVIDVDSKDSSVGMSCPPLEFIDVDYLRRLSKLLVPVEGVLAINVSARDGRLWKLAKERVGSVFGAFPVDTMNATNGVSCENSENGGTNREEPDKRKGLVFVGCSSLEDTPQDIADYDDTLDEGNTMDGREDLNMVLFAKPLTCDGAESSSSSSFALPSKTKLSNKIHHICSKDSSREVPWNVIGELEDYASNLKLDRMCNGGGGGKVGKAGRLGDAITGDGGGGKEGAFDASTAGKKKGGGKKKKGKKK